MPRPRLPANARRSCDRCYANKEKCEREGAASCIRCIRLGYKCSSTRPTKKLGRQALSVTITSPASSSDDQPPSIQPLGHVYSALGPTIPRCFPRFSDLTPANQHLIQQLIFGDTAMNCFLLATSFKEHHRGLLISHLCISRHILQDAFLALAFNFQGPSAANSRQFSSLEFTHAASALKKLTEYEVNGSQGVSECLTLGAMITSLRRRSAPSVASRSLALVKELYESDMIFAPDELIFMPGLIMIEISNCLLYGSIPTLRFRVVSDCYVDRYLGLSSPLLLYLHDICELSNALLFADNDDMPEIIEALDHLDEEVTTWRPKIPPDFTVHFTPMEVSHMLCQVQVMRLGINLIIHRLKFPFGSNEGPASALAISILTQLHLTREATNRTVLSTAIAVMAACFELKTETERQTWYSRIPDMVAYASEFGAYVQTLTAAFWKARETLDYVSWYNIGHLIEVMTQPPTNPSLLSPMAL